MNQKNLNKNITGTQKEDALESIMQQDRDKFLSYRFEVMGDDNIYSVSFNGKLTENEAKKLLAALRNCLYENMADCIQTYLEQHNLAYSGFISSKIPSEHNKVMELAELLLHSDRCSGFESYFGNADTYYLIMDHQKWDAENCCHGCYFAVKKLLLNLKVHANTISLGRLLDAMKLLMMKIAILQSGKTETMVHCTILLYQTANQYCHHLVVWI